MKKKLFCCLLALLMSVSVAACSPEGANEPTGDASASISVETSQAPDASIPEEQPTESPDASEEEAPPEQEEAPEPESEPEPEEEQEPEQEEEPVPEPEDNGVLVVIDAGHQRHGNSEKEPIGPGASETKAKVSSGTSGCVSGLAEYELTLQVSLKLQTELENRGYQVLMVRSDHDVDISNAERAAVANDAKADVFLRIHANGSEDSTHQGAMTICQTKNNPYNAALYTQSRLLAASVLEELVEETGCKEDYLWETDTMSGINWCQIPVTIVEMGYMSNPEEDARMASEEGQAAIVRGIANGVDRYITSK